MKVQTTLPIILLAAATTLAVATLRDVPALAQSAEYCNRYAENAAASTPGPIAGAIGGALGGALPGMLLGGIFGGSKGFGRGAGIGAVIGGIGGVAKHAGAKSRSYDAAYSDCMRG